MDLLSKTKALPRTGHQPVCYSEDQNAKVRDKNLKIQLRISIMLAADAVCRRACVRERA